MAEFSTPMMVQYMSIKKDYPDCLLFFRLGDFYELFLDDAVVGAKALDIILTKRPRGKDGHIPMAGVPFHAADAYIAKLVKAGFKVAICEQVSEPNNRGIVEREVVRIVTPGTILDEKNLRAKEHNYVMSISVGAEKIGIALADVSTGDFITSEFDHAGNYAERLSNEIARFNPVECVIDTESYNSPTLLKILSHEQRIPTTYFTDWKHWVTNAEQKLKQHFSVKTLRGFGLAAQEEATKAASALLGYISHTQKNKVEHLTSLRTYSSVDRMELDSSTIINLELFSTLRDPDGKGSLIYHLDHTKTAIGGRLLRHWIREPLQSKKSIGERLDLVTTLSHEGGLRTKIQKELGTMYDAERIISRLSVGLSTPHDLKNLETTLRATEKVVELVRPIQSPLVHSLAAGIPKMSAIADYIGARIVALPPFDPKNGGLIKAGVDPELDTLRESIRGSTEWVAALEERERKRTGIGSLKVKFNNVFGYYIEVTHSNLSQVPADYLRKQTTVNAERFITPELKVYEDTILRGQEKINKREYGLFLETISNVLESTALLQQVAHQIAMIDCLVCFSETAVRDRYVRPEIISEGDLKIEDGRHPVVERLQDISFVPNSTHLGKESQQLMLITGPNMAGKSVYMRQVALITLMAHLGSFVPAKRAIIPLTDRIFVRSGASDNIGRGLSTFMVEMVETAYILHHATPKSLVIMDEIGRGTSTYDGISIAWAIAEFLVTTPEHAAKTLFATHYHELQDLEKHHPDTIQNYHMAIEESRARPIFLYRITKGGALGSYAIAVAHLAGVPETVTDRARVLLEKFTKEHH
jgi:DNA mismatch repair protein MutS